MFWPKDTQQLVPYRQRDLLEDAKRSREAAEFTAQRAHEKPREGSRSTGVLARLGLSARPHLRHARQV